MRNIISALAVLSTLTACAATPKGRAVQYVVASDAVADEVADGWDEYVDTEIAHCRETLPGTDLDNKAGREECLGLAGKGEALEAAMEVLVVSQTAVSVAVMCESNPLKVPQEFISKCVEPTDWKALGADVLKAWENIRPFYEAVRKARQ